MLLATFIKQATAKIQELYCKEESSSIILMLCQYRLGIDRYTHIVQQDYKLTEEAKRLLDKDVERLMAGEPIQYILSKAEFGDLTFKVDKSVLIPRQESFQLCKIISDYVAGGEFTGKKQPNSSARPLRILDLCTGSGCIAWTLALTIPGAELIGLDISEEALKTAESQDFDELLSLKKAQRPIFQKVDILHSTGDFEEHSFDIIVSNPPYLREEEKKYMSKNVLSYEPHIALFAPKEDALLFYKAIIRWSDKYLNAQSIGFVEINERLGEESKNLFLQAKYKKCELIKDFFDKDRFIVYCK